MSRVNFSFPNVHSNYGVNVDYELHQRLRRVRREKCEVFMKLIVLNCLIVKYLSMKKHCHRTPSAPEKLVQYSNNCNTVPVFNQCCWEIVWISCVQSWKWWFFSFDNIRIMIAIRGIRLNQRKRRTTLSTNNARNICEPTSRKTRTVKYVIFYFLLHRRPNETITRIE